MGLDVEMLTVGPVQENCFLVRREGSDRMLVVDPGEEAERILAAIEASGAKVEAILITHCHFDHIGAVAPVAAATGAPVYCPEIEVPLLADIMSYVPYPGFGPFESYEADETLKGGETLELAGLTLEVVFTPGHSPGHVTYAVRDEAALFSGDVLFQGSVGRVDLPGGDWADAARLDRRPARRVPGRGRRPSRAHGADHARRRARDQPLPRRAGALAAPPLL